MKHIILLLALISGTFISCKKKTKGPEAKPELNKFVVNFYKPIGVAESNVPQLTLKNDDIQITAIGDNSATAQGSINKIYLSDAATKTEWILLVENNKPKFLYGINSETKKKLPFLYSVESTSSTSYILRYYNYDWVNRLGTLEYEVNVVNGNIQVAFENKTSQGKANESNKLSSTSGHSSTNRPVKVARSFPAPVMGFNNRSTKKLMQTNFSGESLDEQFDRQVGSLMDLLRDTKTQLIDAPCKVSKVISSSNKNFVCLMSDAINKYTDQELFDEFKDLGKNNQTDEATEYEGSSNSFNLDFFKIPEIRGNISRHLNDVRDAFSDALDFDDWTEDLTEFNEANPEDLDDLSDKNGVIHIGLSWDTTSDIDLHVTDPYGETIMFSNETSSSGGYLDRDDVDGFGPENIYWMDGGPDGTYKVQVDYYDPQNGPATNYVIKIINGLGFTRTFEGTINGTSPMKTVATFEKNGQSIIVR